MAIISTETKSYSSAARPARGNPRLCAILPYSSAKPDPIG